MQCLPESFAAVGTSEEVNLTQVVGENMVPKHAANSHVSYCNSFIADLFFYFTH